MEHSFDVEIAKKYGVNCAILLKNIYFWTEKNKANNTNYFDGNYWTYNSKKAFAELFPYMNERQIDYALKKLLDEGLIMTGNYNKLAYDRTLWYAITKMGYCILQNCEMESTKLLNGTNKIVEPIPDIITDSKPNIKKESKMATFDEIINAFTDDLEVRKLLVEWLKIRKSKKAPITNEIIELNLQKLSNLAEESGLSITEYLKEVIRRGWQVFYKIKDCYATSVKNNKMTTKNSIAIRQREYSEEELKSAFNNIDDFI